MRDGGLERYRKRVRAIPKAIRKAVEPALVKGADEMAGGMRALVPVDKGDLKESIEVRGPNAGRNNELQSSVSSDDPNARWQEFGTVNQPAQPFFWPSIRSYRKRATNRIKRAISKAVKENWGSR